MSGAARFTADWLALRAPADAAARAAHLVPRHAEHAELRIVDLGCGAGANLRHLAPRLGGRQTWICVDHDEALLDALSRESRALPGASVTTVALDLARDLDALPLQGATLVTASALLDLVAAAWLERLAQRVHAAQADVLFALTYDGRIEWSPQDADDAAVRAHFNAHQRRDKGFGPALGPDAATAGPGIFRALGFRVVVAQSDWSLDAGAAPLQRALLDGFARAAIETAPQERARIEDWRARRVRQIDAARSRLVVGHVDFFATPRRAQSSA